MANEEQLAILKQGVEVWNKWREENPDVRIDLFRANLNNAHLEKADLFEATLKEATLINANLFAANLRGADLSGSNLIYADFFKANLEEADLSGADLNWSNLGGARLINANLSLASLTSADLFEANLREADLSEATLVEANLSGADLIKANLSRANLSRARLGGARLIDANLNNAHLKMAELFEANLSEADLSGADLMGANLTNATLVNTNLTRSILTDCRIYGISAWSLKLEGAEQSNLVITPWSEPTVTVSNIKVAQFLYMLIHNPEIRDIIDTITSKVVLILGRFTDERISILKALRAELQKRDYIPVLFSFDVPKSRDVEETVSTLAHMARFIIADITDPKAIPQELSIIVRNLQSVPVLPLLHESVKPWGMFTSIKRRPTVLPILEYSSESELIGKIQSEVIQVVEQKVIELTP